jgi:hypothetical protein
LEKKIVVNGKEYASVDELPPEERRLYESAMQMLGDRDGDGVPDLLQQGAGTADISVSTTQIVADGRVYRDASELPPEARARYEAAMRRLDADGNGVLDVLEGGAPTAGARDAATSATGVSLAGASPPVESTDRRFWFGLVIVALVVIAALAVWLAPSLLAR